jgi:hypothetical protein
LSRNVLSRAPVVRPGVPGYNLRLSTVRTDKELLLETSILGKTGRTVSRLGFGGATAGLKDYGGPYDPADAGDRKGVQDALAKALELGINYFDNAPGYGNGAGEKIFGEVLAGAEREALFVATKTAMVEADEVEASLAASLENLRCDHVDLLQIHGTAYTEDHLETFLASGGTLDGLHRCRSKGLVRHLGFSVEAMNSPCYRLLECGEFDVVQICYNLLFQHPYDPYWPSGAIYEARDRKLGIVAMRSATSGIFQKWVELVNPENRFDYTPALLQFQLSNPLVDVALVGMRSVSQVEANVAATEDLDARIDLKMLHNRRIPAAKVRRGPTPPPKEQDA